MRVKPHKRATSINCAMLTFNHQRKEEVKMVMEEHTRCMATQSYFLKTLISGKKKKNYYKEVEQDFAPVIQRCVTFPRMIQLHHESSLA